MAYKKFSGAPDQPNVHVRIDFPQAINAKKQILIGEIDILKLIKGINKYSELRRRELELRDELKKENKELKELIEELREKMPVVENDEKSKIREDLSAISRREVIESDLDSIKEKLARLGGM